MISQIDITGFRSIWEQKIPLKKLNILYGQNGSGKSSVMYAPYVFRNFYANPNQRVNSLFNLGFINLGGINDVARKPSSFIKIGIQQSHAFENLYLEISLIDKGAVLAIKFFNKWTNIELNSVDLSIDLPYTLTEKVEVEYDSDKLLWNGLSFQTLASRSENDFKATILNN